MKHYEIADLTTNELADLREAVENEIAQRQRQIAVLTDTLEQLLAASANDAVIENILQAIDILDAATPSPHTEDDVDDEIEAPAEDARKQTITMLRAQGYKAPGFDALVTLYHRDLAEQEWRKAEDATRGHMVKREYRGNYEVATVRKIENANGTTSNVTVREQRTGYDTRNFWFCTMRELQKYASEELLTWFDNNGRLTRSQLRDNLLANKHYAGSGYINNR